MRNVTDTEPFARPVSPTPSPSQTTRRFVRPEVVTPSRSMPGDPSETTRTATGMRRWRSFWQEAWRWLLTGIAFALVAAPLLAASLFGAIYWQARSDQTRPVDAIVVLGTAQYHGRPGPVLEARLEEALAAYQGGNAPLIIVTGGRQAGDQFTEAEASRDFLVANGVPESAVLLENEGRDSWQSMQGVAEILDARDLTRILLVSDGFHLFRLKTMARDLSLTAYGTAASGSPIRQNSSAEFGYIMREAAGLIVYLWER